MQPDRVLIPGPLTYESDALPTALHGPAQKVELEIKGNFRDRKTLSFN